MARRCFCAISLCDFLVLFVLPRARKREYYAKKSWIFILLYFCFTFYFWYTIGIRFFSLYFFFFLFVFPLPSHCFTVVERDVSKKASKNREERRKSEYSRLGEKQHCYLYKHWDTRLLKSCLSFLSVK